MFGHQYFHKLWPSNKWEQDTEFTVIGQSTSPGPANRRAMTKTAIETTRLVGCVCRVAGKQLGEKKKNLSTRTGFLQYYGRKWGGPTANPKMENLNLKLIIVVWGRSWVYFE